MTQSVYCAGVLSEQRHHAIVTTVRDTGTVSVGRLATQLDASPATIRRDLDALATRGLVRRIRGGAADPRRAIRPDLEASPDADAPDEGWTARRTIAERAATLITDGDVIALDIGATTAALCPLLVERHLTVVTASLAVAHALAEAPGVDLFVLGGQVRTPCQSMTGHLTVAALAALRVDIAFLGCSGVRTDGTVLDTSAAEVPVKQGLLDIAGRAYLLAGSQKLPGTGHLQVASIDRFAALITDEVPAGFHLTDHAGRPAEILLACD